MLAQYMLLLCVCLGVCQIVPLQETVSASSISWTICKSASHSRQTTTLVPHHSVFTGRMPFLPTVSKHWMKSSDAEMTVDVLQISASALRAKNLRQHDNPLPTTSTSLRRVDSSTPVLVRDDTAPVSSTWTSEYDREYRPYERSRYRARVDNYAARRLQGDLKPSTPRAHRSYLLTCWPSHHSFCLLTYCTPRCVCSDQFMCILF